MQIEWWWILVALAGGFLLAGLLLGAPLAAARREAEHLRGDEQRLRDQFRAVGSEALRANNEQFLDLARQSFESLLERSRGDLDLRQQAVAGLLDPVRQSLDRLEQRTSEIERQRVSAYSQISEQVRLLAEQAAGIQQRAQSLEGALRGSQTRGRWGEVALRNVVELAGLTEHVDFEEQETTGQGRRRDLTVRRPSGRRVAVDAKVPLADYLQAIDTTDPRERQEALQRHAKAVRDHVTALARRDYASAIEGDIDLTVLFLPAEPIFAAAFEAQPQLQEEAWRSRVVIATPTTLIALLRTVGIYWQQQALAENAQRIADAGQELYSRLNGFAGHLTGLGKALGNVNRFYNQAVGSLEQRVLPSARRMRELRATDAGAIDPPPRIEDEDPRSLTARELLPGDGEGEAEDS